ncbi:hypothetical protein [Nonomuraea sp. CA-141351]|uniref:hypothetical protein n=1 Tax=Nonomuraea sp. CA-141351 TaxID=3239996 RepID=UPI003D9304E8
MTQPARHERRADAPTADTFKWMPYVSHGGILRIGDTSCCGRYELASEGGQFFVLRHTDDGYEETGRGRAHPKVVEIYTALVIEHHNDKHARRGERPKLDDFLL